MEKKYHFITGLPRSGSTLLSNILKQNPRFHSSITDSLAPLIKGVNENVHSSPGIKTLINDEKKKKILTGLFDSFYYDIDKPVIFNTNRMWTILTYVLKGLYPDCKFILCVRDIALIINSFEKAHRRHPFKTNSLFKHQKDVYERATSMMSPEGVVGFAYDGLKQSLACAERDSIFLIEYEVLCKSPESTMTALYNFLEEDYFQHDFNNVGGSYDEYDEDVGIPDLHLVKNKVTYKPVEELIIPPDIVHSFSGHQVWRYGENNK